jgi:hypothetical protein
MGETRHAYRILVGKPVGKLSLKHHIYIIIIKILLTKTDSHTSYIKLGRQEGKLKMDENWRWM